jgi:hypothetical protein
MKAGSENDRQALTATMAPMTVESSAGPYPKKLF